MKTKNDIFHDKTHLYQEYELKKEVEIPELQCILREIIHVPSQAVIIHIENDDPENLFCLSFQTIPQTSNGVAHILEHTVLCGSEKYPVKDPFFSMGRRSLNTFMNALTGADFTCYPAATQIPKDFYNLLSVYIDAVFHPNLNVLSFKQEGHRLEFAQPTNPTTPLEYKGIVYNEMKGALTSPHSRLHDAIHEALYPNITYGINSGGDPKEIPNLTLEELKAFHEQFYHPSRCLYFFYGNFPLKEHLDFLKEAILDKTNAVEPLEPIPDQPRFTTPIRKKIHYPASQESSKSFIGMGWLSCSIQDQEEILGLLTLIVILMDTDASPLKQAILKSKLCTQVNAYVETEYSEVPITFSFTGCQEEDDEKIEQLLFKEIQSIIDKGISMELVENALHQIEFHKSEIASDHAPFGLSLFMRSALLKQHGVEPEKGLYIHSIMEKIKQNWLKNPHYFVDLMQKYLIDNRHFVRVTMVPDQNLLNRELEAEKDKLEHIKQKLTEEEIKKIINDAKELEEFQILQEEEDINVLPKLILSDIPPYPKDFVLTKSKEDSFTAYHHNCFTNEILYSDLFFSIPSIEVQELPYLRLFASLISQLGAGNRNYIENLEYIQAHTGGIGATLAFNIQASNHHIILPSFCLRGKSLYDKSEKLFYLFRDIIETIDFQDKNRLKDIFFKTYTALENGLNQNAMKYAINLSSSELNEASKLANVWYGIDYLRLMKDLALNFEARIDEVIAILLKLKNKIFASPSPDLVLCCSSKMYDKLKGNEFFNLVEKKSNNFMPWKTNFDYKFLISQGYEIASPVAFIGKVFETVSYTNDYSPALGIAAALMDNTVLHSKIREQGGAYGGGAVSNAMSGNFYFYSYRDPNIVNTMDAFDLAIQNISRGKFSNEDLEEARFEIIQALDTPISPSSRADIAYSWLKEEKTFERRKNFRNKILELNKEAVIEAVNELIIPNSQKAATVVFAGKELLERENKTLISKGLNPLELKTVY